jgi:hypothetical protein
MMGATKIGGCFVGDRDITTDKFIVFAKTIEKGFNFLGLNRHCLIDPVNSKFLEPEIVHQR